MCNYSPITKQFDFNDDAGAGSDNKALSIFTVSLDQVWRRLCNETVRVVKEQGRVQFGS
jgi:hypothetical protein